MHTVPPCNEEVVFIIMMSISSKNNRRDVDMCRIASPRPGSFRVCARRIRPRRERRREVAVTGPGDSLQWTVVSCSEGSRLCPESRVARRIKVDLGYVGYSESGSRAALDHPTRHIRAERKLEKFGRARSTQTNFCTMLTPRRKSCALDTQKASKSR